MENRAGSLMSGRWQIPKFLPCAYRTEATAAEQCGFMLILHSRARRLLECWQKIKTAHWEDEPEVLVWNHILRCRTGTKPAQFTEFRFVTLHKSCPSIAPPRRHIPIKKCPKQVYATLLKLLIRCKEKTCTLSVFSGDAILPTPWPDISASCPWPHLFLCCCLMDGARGSSNKLIAPIIAVMTLY